VSAGAKKVFIYKLGIKSSQTEAIIYKL
jgi:hypothetical protein